MKRICFLIFSMVFLAVMQVAAKQGGVQPADSLKNKSIRANQAFIERYKENAELSYLSPLGEIGAPSKYIINGRLTTIFMLLGTKDLPVAFAMVPDFTVRVRNEYSTGVRTPSFKLGGALYVRLNLDDNHYRYAEMSFTHHSNGQDEGALNADGSINTKTGNFSVNYLTASYRFGHFTNPMPNQNDYFSFNYRAGLLWHKWFRYEPAISNDFGFTRLLYDFSWRKYNTYIVKNNNGLWYKKQRNNSKAVLDKETWRFNADASYAINQIPGRSILSVQKRLNLETAFNYSLPFMNNVFLMAGLGYYGEDPYNIYYKDHYAFFRFGLSTGFVRSKINLNY